MTQQLRSGGWDNGCLSFDSNGTAAWLDVVLFFDTLLGLRSLGNAVKVDPAWKRKKEVLACMMQIILKSIYIYIRIIADVRIFSTCTHRSEHEQLGHNYS